jgi:hypothetical protein
MSTERDQREFERYLEYQRANRRSRVETLGGAATMLFLSTIDLGVTEVADPLPEIHVAEVAPVVELTELRAARQRRLAGFATDAAELGYADAA